MQTLKPTCKHLHSFRLILGSHQAENVWPTHIILYFWNDSCKGCGIMPNTTAVLMHAHYKYKRKKKTNKPKKSPTSKPSFNNYEAINPVMISGQIFCLHLICSISSPQTLYLVQPSQTSRPSCCGWLTGSGKTKYSYTKLTLPQKWCNPQADGEVPYLLPYRPNAWQIFNYLFYAASNSVVERMGQTMIL